ncbi:hypothetical protein E2C01_001056 [Portunus trituberculatus]|uniref:Uncharacterized protein n=1 Tax=Portunus trituberculatus TaxID=210409 RepID=A0A5B7CFY7_PORTR|nr:hypothetical protein [Portunus trituberculatus]
MCDDYSHSCKPIWPFVTKVMRMGPAFTIWPSFLPIIISWLINSSGEIGRSEGPADARTPEGAWKEEGEGELKESQGAKGKCRPNLGQQNYQAVIPVCRVIAKAYRISLT